VSRSRYDFAIIGSGVSGGRIAYELTRAGANCVLLEAGREFSAATFPNREIEYSSQLFWGGGLEVSADGHLGFLRARVVGGTSIVNQALLDRFDEIAWDDWRSRSGISFLNSSEMERHYAACEEGLSISEVPPEHYNHNAKIFTEALSARGYRWKPLDRAQRDCKLEKGSDCIVCLGGCPRDSKQSSLITTIRWAREKGLELRSEFEVEKIQHDPHEVRVFGKHRRQETHVIARRVILAAGALGNSKILLRSGLQKKLPALGKGFTCHPQLMTYAIFDEPVDAHKGAFQAVKSDDPILRAQGFKLENVFAPPISTAMLMPGIGQETLELMRKYRHMASIEVALRDDPEGRVAVDSSGKMTIHKKLSRDDRHKARAGLRLVREIFEATRPKKIIQCPQTFGLHLMGGCALGVDADRSVVAPDFSVHGFENLFAADSSVFPGAPGINPSFTVMALAHRASESILKEAAR
jgi:choline dehydrogenase-like flavoprotein